MASSRMRTANMTVLPDERAPTKPNSEESLEKPLGKREWHCGHRRTPVLPKQSGHCVLLISLSSDVREGTKAG